MTAEHHFPRQQSRRGLFAILSIYLHRSALLPRASIGNVVAFALPQVAARRSHSRVPSHRTCNPLPHPHHTAGRLALLATHLSARADFPKKPSRQITTIALATAFFWFSTPRGHQTLVAKHRSEQTPVASPPFESLTIASSLIRHPRISVLP